MSPEVKKAWDKANDQFQLLREALAGMDAEIELLDDLGEYVCEILEKAGIEIPEDEEEEEIEEEPPIPPLSSLMHAPDHKSVEEQILDHLSHEELKRDIAA